MLPGAAEVFMTLLRFTIESQKVFALVIRLALAGATLARQREMAAAAMANFFMVSLARWVVAGLGTRKNNMEP